MMMEEDAQSIEGSLLCFSDLIENPSSIRSSNFVGVQTTSEQSKYAQLLAVIEEMGRDIRPSYAGSKSSVERLKRGIVHSKILIRECLIENERHAKIMAQFIKKIVYKTDLNADSIEWCPVKNYRHLFTCGTYQLCNSENSDEGGKSDQTTVRKGDLYLFQLVKGPEVIKLIEKIELVGILDCKWAHRVLFNNVYLAVATAIGDIRIYKIKEVGTLSLEHVYTHNLCSSTSILALSLDWSTGLNDNDIKIVISDSEGFITMVSFGDGQIQEDCKWKLHEFQAWIVAFNYWDTNVFYSGGDDSHLYIYDRRSNKVGTNDKAHTAGITSMHCNLKQEHVLVSGSYDEKVAFWDTRQMHQPKDLLNTGGGVWRLKWEPENCEDIAAACMHNGFAAIDGTRCSILAEYKDHPSLAYGIDWSHIEQADLPEYFDVVNYPDKRVHVVAMCSFYDNLLSLALFQRDK